MTDNPPAGPHRGPILLCAGTDPATAARLADGAAALLAERPAVVLATWRPPPVMGPLDAVVDALYDAHAELRQAAHDAAADAARSACDALDVHGFDVTPSVRCEDLSPWRGVLDVADEIDAAVIVAGLSDGSPSHPGALGSQARALAHRSRRPLLLLPADGVRPRPEAPALFAYDGSPAADHAIRAAVQLLRSREAIVANVWQTATRAVGVALLAIPDEVARKGAEALDDAARRQAEGRAGEGAALLTAAGWPCETAALETARGVPGALVGAADERDAAVLVTGTRGRSRIAAALLGSTAEGIARHADRPVLLVPPPAGSRHAGKAA